GDGAGVASRGCSLRGLQTGMESTASKGCPLRGLQTRVEPTASRGCPRRVRAVRWRWPAGGSANGRPSDFGSESPGSNPGPPAIPPLEPRFGPVPSGDSLPEWNQPQAEVAV